MSPAAEASTAKPPSPSPAPAPSPAPEPRRSPAAAAPAVLLGLALCAVAALCVRELLLFHEVIGGAPWLANASVWIARLQWQNWMMAAAPAAVIVGLALIVAALKPRARTHLALTSDTAIWLRPTDLARLCSAVALEERNVLSAITNITPTRAEVTVTAAHHVENILDQPAEPDADLAFAELSAELRQRIHGRVSALVSEFARPLEVRVNIRPGVAHTPDQRRRVI